ncbi:MAG TPA: hypothetical protein VIO64_08395 [Pseudobacteroides sp.]|uniref:hypothetical protein n=1 Tax=Pseudobacteroides sp. TaxID=1968840 RepID=UPI002F938D01
MYNIGVESGYLKQAYGNFKKAQKAQFALCFWPTECTFSSEKKYIKTRHMQLNDYAVTGKIVYLNNNVWVVDFGKFMAYAFPELIKQYNGNVKVGDFIEGKGHIDIDMFQYFEYHHKEKDIQPLIYTWSINNILKIVASKVDMQLGKNKDKWDTIEIEQTRCLYDDDGMASYIFQCELLEVEPKFRIELHN